MKLTVLATLACLALVATPATAQLHGDQNAPISTVPDLDINRYTGLWYEIARYPNRFERNCYAVTAEYALNDNGTIAVLNTCREGAVDGPVDVAEGRARIEGPGQLSVNFVRFLPFIRGDYYVLDITDDYSLAVVGEPGRNYGWILARAPQISDTEFARATATLERNGYDLSALERVPQP